ncbi:YbaK/EbsC family protein [Janibacter cremeus]|uniref:Prolyl-tRNA editing enzyme YbaK/EbsC (Cys-tRNA(Pro) deacylase) n=1 Tax=Janibacter cremeus TaxID=1285192 RepID=A0A852VNK3_9MICO|nr:YbaK/EbsC family protein [Janibacter cremeus]NYF98582.1 prolyl-tRNA editing enzyme YbaK/EbsC (Cys-tRNA(Pro) deacylase) [Janibacter cremeus]
MSAAGDLDWVPATTKTGLLAPPVAAAIGQVPSARVAEIDPELADTAAFCEAYGSSPEQSANCVVVAGRRGGQTTYAAVLVLATDRADINNVVRRHIDARKISFAPMDQAVELTGMAYGGITPIGLPEAWRVLVDEGVAAAGEVVIGSGVRGSKLLIDAGEIAALPCAEVLALAM